MRGFRASTWSRFAVRSVSDALDLKVDERSALDGSMGRRSCKTETSASERTIHK